MDLICNIKDNGEKTIDILSKSLDQNDNFEKIIKKLETESKILKDESKKLKDEVITLKSESKTSHDHGKKLCDFDK